ncbi:MAG TPA: response regulator, partial [Stellaceae bacterium]|nr:response regulator [Stellaceae bacterium]
MTATILVVDDEPDLEALVQQRFRRQIRGGEFGFRFAHDGLEALDMIANADDFDMVLSDINMPRMDGLTLLQRIQQTDDPLSTVIVSAYGDLANIRTAMNRGAFDFITKPIDFADLETTIRKTLAHIERIREARRRQAEAERAHALLSRYFSPNLAERLASDPDAVDLGGQRRDITSLFTDISEFTSMVEAIDLKIIAPLLNDYIGGMTEVAFAHGG